MFNMEKICALIAADVDQPADDLLALTAAEKKIAAKRVALKEAEQYRAEFCRTVMSRLNESAETKRIRAKVEAQAVARGPARQGSGGVALRESFDISTECARQIEALKRGRLEDYLRDRRRTYGF